MRTLVFSIVLVAACTDSDPAPVDLAGTWSMTATPATGTCAVSERQLTVTITSSGEGYAPQLSPSAGVTVQSSMAWTTGCDGDSDSCFVVISLAEHEAGGNYLTTFAATVFEDRSLDGDVFFAASGTTNCSHRFDMTGAIQ